VSFVVKLSFLHEFHALHGKYFFLYGESFLYFLSRDSISVIVIMLQCNVDIIIN